MQRAVPAGSGADLEELFIQHLDLLERVARRVCARYHVSPADTDDFCSHVKVTIIESEYIVFAKFKGQSQLKTYLTTVVVHMFLDHRNSMWGKWRPSAAAKRLGPVAVQLERLITRNGYTFDEACEELWTNHGVTASVDELDRMAARFPSRTPRKFESDDTLVDAISPERSPADLAADQDAARVAELTSQVLDRVMKDLSPRDQLILAYRFVDGRTVADIARLLHADGPLYTHVNGLLEQLKDALVAEGLESSAVMEMLETSAVSVEWRDTTSPETGSARPSRTQGAGPWR